MELQDELLDNKAQIDKSILWKIIHKSNFPPEKLLLNLLPTYKDLKCNDYYYQAICFHKSLYHYDNMIDAHHDYLIKDWDCGISISGKICSQHREFRAYFAYLLGHELGHAHICFFDKNLHIHSCLVEGHILEASNHTITQAHVLPHERRLDKFGIYIAEQIYCRKELNEDITTLMGKPECNDRERLKSMLSLPGSSDLNNIRNELIEVTKPFKTELITRWQKDKNNNDFKLLAREVEDFEALF